MMLNVSVRIFIRVFLWGVVVWVFFETLHLPFLSIATDLLLFFFLSLFISCKYKNKMNEKIYISLSRICFNPMVCILFITSFVYLFVYFISKFNWAYTRRPNITDITKNPLTFKKKNHQTNRANENVSHLKKSIS